MYGLVFDSLKKAVLQACDDREGYSGCIVTTVIYY